NLLPPEAKFERVESLGDGVVAYWFGNGQKRIGVAWAKDGGTHRIELPSRFRALDIMGNQIAGDKVVVNWVPIYLAQ
ncbi:MAG: hypothetical protein GDYSWBUE_000439, partial [Candidatus Fervidibacterota bacterium]